MAITTQTVATYSLCFLYLRHLYQLWHHHHHNLHWPIATLESLGFGDGISLADVLRDSGKVYMVVKLLDTLELVELNSNDELKDLMEGSEMEELNIGQGVEDVESTLSRGSTSNS